MTYRPNPDSLAGMVLGFLARNPDEELTLDDIVAKFVHPGDSRNVHTQLMAALDHDMLTYDPEGDVYRKGSVGLPSIRRPDDGDDGTGAKPGAAVKAPPRTTKVATRTPARKVQSSHTQQAPNAINSEANAHFDHRGLAPAFDALITERTAPLSGDRDGMDGNRTGNPQGALPQLDQAADCSNPQPIGTVSKAHGAPARTEKAAHSEALDSRGVGDSAGAISDAGRSGDGAGGREASGRCSWDGLPIAAEAGGHSTAPANRDGATDSGVPVPQGDQQSPIHAELAASEHAGGITGDSGAVSPAGSDPAGGQESAKGKPMITTVRQHLLDTLVDLRNPEKPMPIDRAKAVAEVAAVLVNSAKVEVEYLKATQQRRGTFFEALPAPGGGA